MQSGLRASARAVLAAAFFAVAVVVVLYGGQAFFALPGLAANSAAAALVGQPGGPLATGLFLLFAIPYVGFFGLVLGLVARFARPRRIGEREIGSSKVRVPPPTLPN